MDALMAVLLAIGTLLVGLAVGWFAAARATASLRQDCDALRARCGEAERESAAAGERAVRAEQLQKLLDAVTAERDDAQRARAALEADARNFDARMAELRQAKEALVVQFREIGDKLLEKAHAEFLAKADDRLSKADKEQTSKLQALLQPVEATLKRYEEGLQRVEKERVDHYAGLREAVDLVRAGQGQVRDETRNLVNALRSSPKARGRWGEQSLRNVLEQAGLSPYADFCSEVSVETDDGRLRPDVVVRLPGGRQLVIDAKCTLNAYLEACEEVDEDKRDACFRAHVASMRTHVQQLGSKSYWAQFGDAADYVVMYIPGEHFLTAALEQDPTLWDWAFDRRVLLATPTNLVAIARTVASVWKQEKLAAEAGKIAELGRELHSRLATMAEHVASVGVNLSRANNAYNKMVGSLESQVLTQARKFEDHGAGSAKALETPPMVEASPRPLTKLASPSNDDPPQIAAE
jgi:DNA recombination protein RmuC